MQVSPDATAWTDVYTTTAGAGGTTTVNKLIYLPPVRYVRLYGTVRNGTSNGYEVKSLEIWGQ